MCGIAISADERHRSAFFERLHVNNGSAHVFGNGGGFCKKTLKSVVARSAAVAIRTSLLCPLISLYELFVVALVSDWPRAERRSFSMWKATIS